MDKLEIQKDFGKMLSIHRVDHGYTRNEIADKLDVGVQTIYQWERGMRAVPLNHMIALSKLLNFSLDEFFELHRSGNFPKYDRIMQEKLSRWQAEFSGANLTPEEIEKIKEYTRFLIAQRGEEK